MANIGSYDGLSPVGYRSHPEEKTFGEIVIGIRTFSVMKFCLEMVSVKLRSSCIALNMLTLNKPSHLTRVKWPIWKVSAGWKSETVIIGKYFLRKVRNEATNEIKNMIMPFGRKALHQQEKLYIYEYRVHICILGQGYGLINTKQNALQLKEWHQRRIRHCN